MLLFDRESNLAGGACDAVFHRLQDVGADHDRFPAGIGSHRHPDSSRDERQDAGRNPA